MKLDMGELTRNNVNQVRKLIEACTPDNQKMVEYDYLAVIQNEEQCDDLVRLAYCNDSLVGAILCSVHDSLVQVDKLAILSAYRGVGLGKLLLQDVVSKCRKGTFGADVNQISMRNGVPAAAAGFYEKIGFAVGDTLPTGNVSVTLAVKEG